VAGIGLLKILALGAAVVAVAQGARAEMPAKPPRTLQDIVEFLAQHKLDQSAVHFFRAALETPEPKEANAETRLAYHQARADAAEALGLAAIELEARRKVVELARDHQEQVGAKGDLSVRERHFGNLRTGMELAEAVANDLQADPGRRMSAFNRLAIAHAEMGSMHLADRMFERAESSYRESMSRPGVAQWWSDFITSMIECVRGQILVSRGRFAAAEAALLKSLKHANRDLEIAEERSRRFAAVKGTPPAGTTHLVLDICEGFLVEARIRQGSFAEAEFAARASLHRIVRRVGGSAPQAARAIARLAAVMLENGRAADAVWLASEAVSRFEAIGSKAQSIAWSEAEHVRASALLLDGRWAEAAQSYERVGRAFRDAAFVPVLARPSAEWVIALVASGSPREALRVSEELAKQSAERLGGAHYLSAEARALHAAALAASGEKARARELYAEAFDSMLAARARDDEAAGSALRQWKFRWILDAYLDLLLPAGGTPSSTEIAEAFRVADTARAQAVQRAIMDAAVRVKAADPALAELIRKDQDLRNESHSLRRILINLLSVPERQRLPKVIEDMRARLEAITGERRALGERVAKAFPSFENLINPKPPTVEAVQRALRPGEVLLAVYTGESRTYVWAVPQGGAVAFGAAPLGRSELLARVARLRRSLEPSAHGAQAIPLFDISAAYSLYEALLRPVETVWREAAQLMVVPHGPIAHIPLGVLATAPETPRTEVSLLFAEYRAVPWLAKRVAITQLPSANAMLALRALPAPSAARKPFAGFGDPVFSMERRTRSQDAGAAQVSSASVAMRSAPNTRILDSAQLAHLPRLPDTADEVIAIANVLGAGEEDVFLGERASEKEIKARQWSDRQVIAFATHGLLPGDLDGLTQPALALTTPEITGGEGDGLLTLDEILDLKLDADWVVLSACNTAAGEGAGAEAVSGLGRAFFYAGTRALLVSNWPVETKSAKLLTTGIFERQAKDASLKRSEALRQAMLALMETGVAHDSSGKPVYSYAHPIFWAPFTLVGDGG
jgi:CHAT domain-containing protein